LQHRRLLLALAIAASPTFTAAQAATEIRSMGVRATVVAACSIVPAQLSGTTRTTCAQPAAGSVIVAPQPAVTFSTDPATGITRETITF
jgi:hypothetical protein